MKDIDKCIKCRMWSICHKNREESLSCMEYVEDINPIIMDDWDLIEDHQYGKGGTSNPQFQRRVYDKKRDNS